MPSKTPSQHRLMEAVAHSPKFAKKVGIPQKVGKEFVNADKKMKDGGVVKSLKKAGFYDAEKNKAERINIINKVTTKPQRLEIVDELFSGKKMKGGGLYENIHAKRERIAEGSGEKMRRVGSKGAPTADAFKQSAKTAGMKEGGVSLSVGRGEKLPVSKGAGLTEKGRAKYNRETGSNLKAPQPQGGSRKDSFCARMSGVVENSKGDAPRAKASLKRWDCPGW
jgi:hypothetical protein